MITFLRTYACFNCYSVRCFTQVLKLGPQLAALFAIRASELFLNQTKILLIVHKVNRSNGSRFQLKLLSQN